MPHTLNTNHSLTFRRPQLVDGRALRPADGVGGGVHGAGHHALHGPDHPLRHGSRGQRQVRHGLQVQQAVLAAHEDHVAGRRQAQRPDRAGLTRELDEKAAAVNYVWMDGAQGKASWGS